jgi:hypothetical protein
VELNRHGCIYTKVNHSIDTSTTAATCITADFSKNSKGDKYKKLRKRRRALDFVGRVPNFREGEECAKPAQNRMGD